PPIPHDTTLFPSPTLFRSEPWVEFHGRFFDISNVSVDPKPVQKPHPPIVFGATTKAGARRAARTSDALYTVHLEPYIEIGVWDEDRKSTRLNSSHVAISYA